MASVIRIKRSTGVAAPGSLKTGELAYTQGVGTAVNLGDRLFFGKGDDGSGNATSVVTIGGEYFGNQLDHAPGTLTASSAIITDASGKIDVLNVDNITINGNTISSTNTDGNIVLDPNGAGTVDVNTSKIVNVTDPSSAQDAATKAYVDAQVSGGTIGIAADTGSDTVKLDDSDLTFTGDTGITTSVTNNTVTIDLDNTAVTPASYGSATAVPVITVDQQGRLTAASTATISTTMNLAGESGTGSVSLVDSSLEITGGQGIDTVASGNTITISGGNTTIGSTAIALGGTSTVLAGLTQVDVDNIRLFDNTVGSTTGTLVLDGHPLGDDDGTVLIRGNLQVDGTTTTVNSTTVSINDLNIVLADSAANAAAANGAGITVNGASATLQYSASADDWVFNKGVQATNFEGIYLGFDSDLSAKSTNNLTEGSNLYFTNERVDDRVASLLLAGEAIDLTYDDTAGSLTVTTELATVTNPGAANFDSDQMSVTSGLVSITELDGGTF